MENPHQLLQLARDTTGLHDFGPDSFREGLEILVTALAHEARLNAVGEQIIRERILGHLTQRLFIEDWYHRHPEIDEQQIVAPLIGLSLPRTGSTALSFLLAQDPNARSLLREEAAQPATHARGASASASSAQNGDSIAALAGWKPHTPSGDQAPAECQDLMALDFKSQMFQALAQIPTYSEWLHNEADLTPTYEYERRALKLLQWQQPAKPWRLKCPTHLIFLPELNHVFPDARFVMTHRDPAEVILSVIDVYADIVGRFTDHLDMHYLAELNLQQWSDGMQRTLTFRDRDDNNARFFDIDFRAMHRDPIAEVRELYRWLGEPVSEEFASGMSQWWQENSENREPSTTKQAEDYGVDLDRARPLFADYTLRMHEWTNRR
jgi:hypothetical protein